MIFAMLFAVMAVNAQSRGYVCTGNNVTVRKGPGKNYGAASQGFGNILGPLSKGTVVKYAGKKRNGFVYVQLSIEGIDYTNDKGWVPERYIRSVTVCNDGWEMPFDHYCNRCKGKGYW